MPVTLTLVDAHSSILLGMLSESDSSSEDVKKLNGLLKARESTNDAVLVSLATNALNKFVTGHVLYPGVLYVVKRAVMSLSAECKTKVLIVSRDGIVVPDIGVAALNTLKNSMKWNFELVLESKVIDDDEKDKKPSSSELSCDHC